MKVLLLGVGMQGKVALHDLVQRGEVTQVLAADQDFEALKAYVESGRYGRVRCEQLDATSPESIERLMDWGPDVVIDLLPVTFHGRVAAAAVKQGVHLVNASYAGPEVRELADQARARDVTLLPEFGMDPGIDLVLLGEAVR